MLFSRCPQRNIELDCGACGGLAWGGPGGMADLGVAERLLRHADPFAQCTGARLLADHCRSSGSLAPAVWPLLWDGLTRNHAAVTDVCAELIVECSTDPVADIRRCLSLLQNLQPR